MYEQYLQHHGIKGMKWGVIRTKAQLARASKKSARLKEQEGAERTTAKKQTVAKRAKTTSTKTDISQMTDDELTKAINRLRNEQTYAALLAKNESKVSAGRKFVNEVLYDSSKEVAKQVAKYAMATAVNKAAGKKVVPTGQKKG